MNIGTTGSAGEEYAAEVLTRKGYEIITRNYRSRFGEIDIICKNDKFIAFVEVKT
ncbi:MAG: YraN family protein, partial [Clostridia bacterium]|nr:YraN family protein [Clostridia bacterium]